jgi:hypothetical protein
MVKERQRHEQAFFICSLSDFNAFRGSYFFSGVLLGLWFVGPSTSSAPTNQAPAVNLAIPQEEQQPPAQANPAPQYTQPSNYAKALGMATGGVIASAPLPTMFLPFSNPL